MKGIVLAGGSGTRLHPVTRSVSKQLLPVYDKPMIYYPLSVLMFAGIRDIMIISTPHDLPLFERLLGTGQDIGVRFSYAEQAAPNGLAEAFIIGREFIGDDDVCLVLGDNIFYGEGLSKILKSAVRDIAEDGGCQLFGYRVSDPERYGVAEVDDNMKILSIEEKPAEPKSDIAANLKPSARGELEITDVNRQYVGAGKAHLQKLGRGMAWLDTGTHDSLLEAATFVQVLEHRQGVQIACLEEIAFEQRWITSDQLASLADALGKSSYGQYLRRLASSSH
jgi:glucose-1-phosphate thymidylyltransferase